MMWKVQFMLIIGELERVVLQHRPQRSWWSKEEIEVHWYLAAESQPADIFGEGAKWL